MRAYQVVPKGNVDLILSQKEAAFITKAAGAVNITVWFEEIRQALLLLPRQKGCIVPEDFGGYC